MDGHLKLFQYLSQYEDFIKSPDYLDPNVSWVLENDKVYYNYTPINNGGNEQVKPYESEYLTMELLEEGKLTFARVLCKDVMYSTDNGNTWAEIDNGAESIMEGDISNLVYTPTFPAGTKVLWKSNIDKSLIGASPMEGADALGFFGSTCNYNLSGNIMSLIYGDDYATNSELAIDGVSLTIPFYGIFGLLNSMIHGDCYDTMSFPGVVDATNLILPAMTLTPGCYSFMFYLCTSLKYAPELPATTLAEYCYYGMFSYCSSLTTAPELPVTTLAEGCYSGMFEGCTSLTTAPELHATTLANYCYEGMFSDCSNLNEITMLATDISASYCLSAWVNGVASTGTFYHNPEMDSLPIGTDGIPEGWTIIPPYGDIVGHLTFEAIEDGTFSFTNHSTNIKYRIEDGEWVSLENGTSTPTVSAGSKIYFKAPKPSIINASIGTFSSTGRFNASGNIMSMIYGDGFEGRVDLTGYPNIFRNVFSNCVGLVDASELILPATTLAWQCYYGMFSGCANLINAPELPATTLANECYKYMFSDCTSLVTAPELPVTTLTERCYEYMFSGCTSLTTAPELPAETLANYCCFQMFYGCTSLATAPELPAETLADGCYSYMFQGCTSLASAPVLPATTMVNSCYSGMFLGCTNLNDITILAIDISASDCLTDWVEGVASTGTFTKHPDMNSLPTGDSGIPSGWTVVNYEEM